jgi:hypothetical protein
MGEGGSRIGKNAIGDQEGVKRKMMNEYGHRIVGIKRRSKGRQGGGMYGGGKQGQECRGSWDSPGLWVS